MVIGQTLTVSQDLGSDMGLHVDVAVHFIVVSVFFFGLSTTHTSLLFQLIILSEKSSVT